MGIYWGELSAMFTEAARIMREDSERWFPDLHEQKRFPLGPYYALGMSGEAGEVANQMKKILRDSVGQDKLGEEIADTFTYLVLLADEMGIDIATEYVKKRQQNETRFGGK